MNSIKYIYQVFFLSQYLILWKLMGIRSSFGHTWGIFIISRFFYLSSISIILNFNQIQGNRFLTLSMIFIIIIDFFFLLKKKERLLIENWYSEGKIPNKYLYMFTKVFMLMAFFSIFIVFIIKS